MMIHADSFGTRLKLALKACNVSAQQFGSAIGADKSVISRWLSGRTTPTAHNLSRISAELARFRPGFSALLWDAPVDEFLECVAPGRTGRADAPPAVSAAMPPDASAAIWLHSLRASDRETRQYGPCYVGLYLALHLAMTKPNWLRAEIMQIRIDGGRMHFSVHDGEIEHGGPIMVLSRQLYFIGESHTREDGLYFCVVNGTQGFRAMSLDGLLTSTGIDRYNTPCSMRMLLLRVGDSVGDAEQDRQLYDRAATRIRAINAADLVTAVVPERFQKAVDNASRLASGEDWNLRAPLERGFTWSDIDQQGAALPLPELSHYLLADSPGDPLV